VTLSLRLVLSFLADYDVFACYGGDGPRDFVEMLRREEVGGVEEVGVGLVHELNPVGLW
jgi:hypothetical protein